MLITFLLSLITSPLAFGQFVGILTEYNNTCLWEKEGLNRDGPKEFDCPRFVIESTDQIWNMYRESDLKQVQGNRSSQTDLKHVQGNRSETCTGR